jgi:PAS domain S-box-containing protein
VRTKIVRVESGRIIKRYGTTQDITDRKLVEKALIESEEKHRNVIEHSLIGFYIIKDGLFRFVNKQFCEILGRPYEDIVDKAGPLDFVHPEDREIMAENLRRRISGETDRVEYEVRTIREDGQIVNLGVISFFRAFLSP